MIRLGGAVRDQSGRRGEVRSQDDASSTGESSVLIEFEGGLHVRVPAQLIAAAADGTYRIPFSLVTLTKESAGTDATGSSSKKEPELVVPVVREELEVGKRIVELGTVRIHKSVTQRQEVIDEPLWREAVEVERIPVNQVVEEPMAARHEGDRFIVPLYEEVLVVQRRLILREEIHLWKRRSPAHAPQTVTLRSEEVTVERIPARSADDERSQIVNKTV